MRKIYNTGLSFIFILGALLCDIEASTFSINILNPHEAEEVSGDILISAKIEEDGKAFLERGGLRWVSVVVKDARGVESIKISLRDNGRGEDAKPDDGIWTSLAKVKLPEGKYSLFVVVKKNEQTNSTPEVRFRIKSEHRHEPPIEIKIPETKEGNVLKETRKIASKIDGSFESLSNQLIKAVGFMEKINSTRIGMKTQLKWILLIGSVSLFVLIGIFGVLLKKHSKGKIEVEKPGTEPAGQHKEIIPSEKWRPVFSALENMSKEISQMEKDLSGTFHIHSRYKNSFEKIVSNIISLYESVKDLKEIPKEHVNAFKLSLVGSLETVGVEKWEPEIGKLAPEGCDQKSATQDCLHPENTVVEVLSPGYRIQENEGFVIIKKPIVVVSQKNIGGRVHDNHKY